MQQAFEFPVNPKYTFENFVVCRGNSTAHHFARTIASDDGTENLLYLHGSSGSGKTHLISAIAASASRHGVETIPCLSFRDIDEIYHGTYPAEEVSRLAEKFRSSPMLLLDDIHHLPDNQNLRVEVWQIFNDFYNSGKKIVVTGHLPPRELPHMDDHLVSRLLWGLVAGIDISDDESRRMIVNKLAQDRHIIIPADVINYLLLHERRDIPSLLRALEAIRRLSFAKKRKVTVRLAREALEVDR